MSAVINRPETNALVDHFVDALRENLENGELTLPTNDEELRAAAVASVATIVQSQRPQSATGLAVSSRARPLVKH